MKRETDMAKAEESKVHKLKTWPMFFQAVLEGSKPFELRKNDRHFNVGDILILEEYDPDAEGYTGRKCERKISYVLDANPFIDLHGHVILGLESRPAVLMPEEEEIKQEAIKAANRSQFMSNWIYDHKSYEEGYLIGAKWALSQVQAIDGRELLERFKKWQKLNHYDASERNTDVDAFLRDNAT